MRIRRWLCWCLLGASSAVAAPTVVTRSGPLTGTLTDGVCSYKGIPYAAPPVGPLRWRPPQPPAPWTAPRAATEFSAVCPQGSDDSPFDRGRSTGRQSEDCLYLNVWTAEHGPDRRPVMVWIHGGGLVNGAGSKPYYDGAQLARRGVVVVTINYRLGAFGFLTHAALAGESADGSMGNWGFLDQIAALRWVRDNIAAFGGDASNVTIFGESAGAVSVHTLLASPAARGLFHRAIAQSGAALSRVRTLAASQAVWREKLAAVGVKDAQPSAAALRALSAADLVRAYHGLGATPGTSSFDLLCLDGVVLTEAPAASFAAGRQAPVPLIVGSNRDEGTIFTRLNGVRTKREFEARARRLSPAHADDLLAAYPAATDEQAAQAYTAALGDASFTAPTRRSARWHAAAGPPTYRYWFCVASALADRFGLGVFHGAEIPFVFGNLERLLHRAPQRPAATALADCWTSFAATGRPASAGLPEWSRYDPQHDNTMVFSDHSALRDGVRTKECDLWDRVANAF